MQCRRAHGKHSFKLTVLDPGTLAGPMLIFLSGRRNVPQVMVLTSRYVPLILQGTQPNLRYLSVKLTIRVRAMHTHSTQRTESYLLIRSKIAIRTHSQSFSEAQRNLERSKQCTTTPHQLHVEPKPKPKQPLSLSREPPCKWRLSTPLAPSIRPSLPYFISAGRPVTSQKALRLPKILITLRGVPAPENNTVLLQPRCGFVELSIGSVFHLDHYDEDVVVC